MRHAMLFGVLLALVSGGISAVDTSVDKVAIGSNGVMNVHRPKPLAGVPSRKREAGPNDLPFVLDTAMSESAKTQQGAPAKAPVPFAANSPFELDTSFTPFEVDPGPAGAMGEVPRSSGASDIQTGLNNDSPFVLDEQGTPPPAGPHWVAADGSPFVADSAPGAASAIAKPTAGGSPFVMDTQMSEDDAEDEKAKLAAKVKPAGKVGSKPVGHSEGKLSIVKNGRPILGPQPPTTRMVMKFPVRTTTRGPTTSKPFTLELGGSMLQIRPGQPFVAIHDTPFEMETEVALKLAQRPQRQNIELLRPGIPAAAALEATAATSGAMPEMEERKTVPNGFGVPELVPISETIATPQLAKRLMRNEEQPGALAQVSVGQVRSHEHDSQPNIRQILAATPAEELVEVDEQPPVKNTSSSSAVPKDTSPVQPVEPVTDSATPLTPPVTNGSLSAPQAIFNSSIAITSNSTNGTAVAHAEKKITVKGAFISILIGLLVTLFFLSLVLCFLRAGRDETPAGEEKEPTVPKRSYRQLLKAQEAEANQAASSPPSA